MVHNNQDIDVNYLFSYYDYEKKGKMSKKVF